MEDLRTSHLKMYHNEILLYALIRGYARWEFFHSNKEKGEVCFNGLRYCCNLDSNGLPILDKNICTELHNYIKKQENR